MLHALLEHRINARRRAYTVSGDVISRLPPKVIRHTVTSSNFLMASDKSQSNGNEMDSNQETNPNAKVLPEPVKKFFESINAGNVDDVKTLLAQGVPVDSLDDHGMTPLQHAAYKGIQELCELFLNHGADVNAHAHDHGYTALMFAALTGNKNIIKLLLERGAKPYMENSVHRTAAQMAAFVGQHEVVSLINNYFSQDSLDYYCTPRGLETEPKLPPTLSTPLYKYIMIVNLNPVKLSLHLQQSPELLLNSDKVTKVLDILCEKMMKQHDTDEIMSLKFHYLSFVIKRAVKMTKEKGNNLEFWFKYLLKGRELDGFPDNQECLIRSMLQEFPYVESQLLQQIVRTLTSSQIIDKPTACSVLTSCINGQRFATAEDRCCSTCGDLNAMICAICKSVFYCNKTCQKLHWFVHKKFCKELAEKYEEKKKAEEARVQVEASQGGKGDSKEDTVDKRAESPLKTDELGVNSMTVSDPTSTVDLEMNAKNMAITENA